MGNNIITKTYFFCNEGNNIITLVTDLFVYIIFFIFKTETINDLQAEWISNAGITDNFNDPLQEETQEEEVDVEDEVTQDRRSDPQSKESELEILDFNASQSHSSHVNAMNIHSQEDESL